ncbi:MAG: transaldolase [Gammaproteobacteria bacterium]|nr:transaldolase [Gammaproteobacteria bacterium]
MSLRLFLDSADAAQWRAWLPSGLFYGVTTNPTLLRRAGLPSAIASLRALTHEATALGAREIHLQAWGGSAEAYYACGQELAGIDAARICVKLPLTRAGSVAAGRLLELGVRVTLTTCFDASQLLVAAALGVDYAAPYLGRICDAGRDGHAEVIAMQRVVTGVGARVRVLVASLRNLSDLSRLAGAGLQTFTLAVPLVEALLQQPQTLAAAQEFEAAARAPSCGDPVRPR